MVNESEQLKATGVAVSAADEEAVYCPRCGYDLRTLTGPTCPECGAECDPQAMRLSRVPWLFRRVGWFRALRRTVWAVSVRPARFSLEMERPVDLREALRFRRTIVWLTFWTLPVLTGSCFFIAGDRWYSMRLTEFMLELLGWPVAAAVAAGCVALSWLFFYALTGVHTYWCHPRRLPIEQQNRALALSYYACAPLALLVLGMPVLVLGCMALVAGPIRGLWEDLWLGWRDPWSWVVPLLGAAPAIVGGAMVFVAMIAFWRACLSMARHAAGRGRIGLIVMGAALPVIWAAVWVLIFVVIPAPFACVWASFWRI